MRLRSIVIVTFFAIQLQAQQPNDQLLTALDSTIQHYASALEQPDLFLHTDKTIYVPQESIWFTAYILNKATTGVQHTLYTVLVEESTKKILASERFMIDSGMAKGSLLLPDSISPGEYRLLAYTNTRLTHQSQPTFQQSITIKNNGAKLFRLSFQPSPVLSDADDYIRFKYKVLTDYGGLASKGYLSYILLADGKEIQQKKKEEIDAFGEVSFSLLKKEVWHKKIKLIATIARGQDKQDIQAIIPLFEDVAFVRIYPESGPLVVNRSSRVALEIKNGLGVPVAAKGQLLEDNAPVSSFKTDQYGNVIVELKPLTGKKYTIKLEDGYKHIECDSFPIDASGFTLRVNKPVIKDSSFQVEIHASDTGVCHILVHNYRSTFFSATIRLSKKSAVMPLSTALMPEGVSTITIFDAKGDPRAERAVYIQKSSSSSAQVNIKVDSSSNLFTSTDSYYGKRQPLSLKVTVTDGQGKPVRSRFSLSCVLTSRLDTTRMPDIVRFQRFDRFLPEGTAMPGSQYLENTANIEMLLLTKFWTKYKWKEIDAVELPKQGSLCDVGDLYYKGRRIKERVNLMIFSDDHTYPISTDSNGHFELPPDYLRVKAGSRVSILVMNKKRFQDYTINFSNQCQTTDTSVAVASHPEASYPKAELSVDEQQQLKGAMKAVYVIKKLNDGIFRSSNCNDFVCPSNILNCTFHKAGRRPMNGESYIYLTKNSLMSVASMPTVIYKGDCGIDTAQAGFLKKVKGISYAKEFYVANYVQHDQPQPDMRSTIFWDYVRETDEKGEATLEFPTNDLSGRFVFILQGISDNGAISKKEYFKVAESETAPHGIASSLDRTLQFEEYP
jgi:hypothetical protein